MNILLYLGVGACVGTLSGLFGIGGGIVIVPTLLFLFQKQGFPPEVKTYMALGTSLATIIITAAASTYRHFNLGNLQFKISKKLLLPIAGGIFIGGCLTTLIDAVTLEMIFTSYLYLISLKMLLYKNHVEDERETSQLLYTLAGGLIGFKSAILGVGGGTLSVPFLTWRGFKMKNAVAISASLGIPIAILGTGVYIYNGLGRPTPEYSLGYVYIPAFLGISTTSFFFTKLGAKISSVANQVLLKKIFAIFLMIMAIEKTVSYFN